MKAATLRAVSDGLLAVAGLVALAAAWLYLATGTLGAAIAMVACAACPAAAMAGWRRRPPFAGWGWMVPYGLVGFLLGFSAGGFLLYGLVPFGFGNLGWRWFSRSPTAGAQPNP